MAELLDILRQADIFLGLEPDQLEMINNCCFTRTYAFEEVVFPENSSSSELYIIAEGEVEIQVDPALVSGPTTVPSVPSTIATLRRGQCFGEIALVDQGIRSASAVSVNPETILVILPRDHLMETCNQHPQLGYILMRNLAADLALKIRSTDLLLREHLLYNPRGSIKA